MALLSVSDIIDRSWELYRRQARQLLVFSLVLFIPDALVVALADGAMPFLASRGLHQNLVLALGLVFYLPLSVASIWISIALLKAVAAKLQGEGLQPRAALLAARPHIVPVILATIAMLLLTMAGFIALIIPGIIVYVWFAFVLPLIVLDGEKWMPAFGKSRALVTGRFWPVLWRVLAPHLFWFLLGTVASGAATLLMNGAAGTWSIAVPPGAPAWVWTASNLTDSLIRSIITPLFLTSMLLLYLSLKKEPTPAKA